MSGDVEVLARVSAHQWHRLTKAERLELGDWLAANDIVAMDVLVDPGIAVVLMDAPAVVRDEVVRDEATGRVRFDRTRGDVLRRRVASLLRVPLPEHLADPA